MSMRRIVIVGLLALCLLLVGYVYLSYRAAERYLAPVRKYLLYKGFAWGELEGRIAFNNGVPSLRFIHDYEIKDGLSCCYNGLFVVVDMKLQARGVEGKYVCTNDVSVDEEFCEKIRQEYRLIERGEY